MRHAGRLLILTAVATVVAVVGRVAAGADQPTLAASLAALAASRGLYGTGGAARFVSGITLIAAAWYLFKTRSDRGRRGSPVVPSLFAASGVFTAYSGASAVVLAALVPEAMDTVGLETPARHLEVLAWLRQLTGAIGFAATGVALLVAGRHQWGGGGALRRIAPASALLGLAMQFVWLDTATVMHMITGILFVVWLAGGGGMLLKGRPWLPG